MKGKLKHKGTLFLKTTLFMLIAHVCSGQASIIGKWNYVGIQPVGSDPWSQQLIDIVIGENSYKQFYPNNLYTTFENDRKTYGRWKYTDNRLVTTSYDGEIRTFEITKLTNDTLIVLGKKKTYGTLVKDLNASEEFVVEPPQNSTPIRSTTKQISKKWILKDTRLISTPTEEEKMANRIFTNVLRSSWYDFKSDGVVHSKFTSLKTLKWYFENQNKSIVMIDDNGDGSVWNIISISKSELILQKPHAATQLIFDAQAE